MNTGLVGPGGTGAAGQLFITGNYTQTAAGTLAIEIGGYSAGTDFDQLQVGGTATLDGTLAVTMFNDFRPQAGDGFRVLTFAAVSGDFAQGTGLDLGGSLSLAPAYDDSGLTLIATQS